jgi:hypothetical protein
MRTYWLAIDENGDETIHQYEPSYNRLHRKWKSTTGVYITKGMAKLIFPPENLRESNSVVKAIAYEIEEMGLVNNKVRILNTNKIF